MSHLLVLVVGLGLQTAGVGLGLGLAPLVLVLVLLQLVLTKTLILCTAILTPTLQTQAIAPARTLVSEEQRPTTSLYVRGTARSVVFTPRTPMSLL